MSSYSCFDEKTFHSKKACSKNVCLQSDIEALKVQLQTAVENYSTEKDVLSQKLDFKTKEYIQVKNELSNATKHLREQMNKDKQLIRKQLREEIQKTDEAKKVALSAQNEVSTLSENLQLMLKEKLCLESELTNLRKTNQNLVQSHTETKRAMFELAKQQEKLQVEKIKKETTTWQSDDAVSRCRECGTEFSVFNRKHHCRCCGKIFCGSCTAHRLRIPGHVSAELQRVCNSCCLTIN